MNWPKVEEGEAKSEQGLSASGVSDLDNITPGREAGEEN